MQYREVKTGEDVQKLNVLYGYFADAMIVQMTYTGGDYADRDGYGHPEQTNCFTGRRNTPLRRNCGSRTPSR